MILSVGEILADMIGSEKDGAVTYSRYAGGAPFNVACGAKKFGASVGFVGRVGDDCIGRWLKQVAESKGFDYTDVQVDGERNTTLAFVELSIDGERSFSFYRKHTADYHIGGDLQSAVDRADIVHVGSLALTADCGKAYADRLFDYAHKKGKRVSFDMNFRDDLFDGKDVFLPYVNGGDIVKLSEDEIYMFGDDLQATAKKLSQNKLVAITLGSKGSAFCYCGDYVHVPGISVKPVDTTGAGDAFYAGLLAKLDACGEITREKLIEAFRFANVCGALTTTARGAIDALPDIETVQKYL